MHSSRGKYETRSTLIVHSHCVRCMQEFRIAGYPGRRRIPGHLECVIIRISHSPQTDATVVWLHCYRTANGWFSLHYYFTAQRTGWYTARFSRIRPIVFFVSLFGVRVWRGPRTHENRPHNADCYTISIRFAVRHTVATASAADGAHDGEIIKMYT